MAAIVPPILTMPRFLLRTVEQLFFVGSARDDLRAFPEDVKDATGFALYLAQVGDHHPHAK